MTVPPYRRQRVHAIQNGETETCTTFFYPASSRLEPDGTLVMRVSRYTASAHESGVDQFSPDNPDYAMWCSFAKAFKASPPAIPFVSSESLDAIRREWARENSSV